ncbi:DUF4345 family protein [Rhizobium halophytocola]|uniref:DUF4345 domain-containing protein n=1 Tax=Rhizobium halophytocola TaxID=735519 RepID=A0ABS4E2U4_9HYPH|nr:DUF4345 family protein [Rhizobium halophytocola]MBP1852238.1 hypothetical protein [Rhizobium halophytocola]
MEFYFPTEFGEQMAFVAGCVTIAIGLLLMFVPGYAARIYNLMPIEGCRDGYGLFRSIGGFFAGSGIAAIMLAQPTIYMTLGGAYVLAAFGRFLSILSDRAGSVINLAMLVVELALAAMMLAYVFQLV